MRSLHCTFAKGSEIIAHIFGVCRFHGVDHGPGELPLTESHFQVVWCEAKVLGHGQLFFLVTSMFQL